MLPLQLVDALYTLIIKCIYDRSNKQQQTATIADTPLSKFNNRLKSLKRFKVFESGNGIYQVQIPDSGIKYITNLRERTCECTYFQDDQSPCTHAIIACRYETEDPFEYFIPEYSVSAYRKTYKHFLHPVSIENLALDPRILPPVFAKQRGRPRTKRIRKGSWKKKPKLCSSCQDTGHDKRTCRQALVLNGRRQRARDREPYDQEASDLDSTDLDSSVGDSEEVYGQVDEQFDIEMALYDARLAKAIVVSNRQHQSTCDSNSELSILATGQFDSMEGIEMGGSNVQGTVVGDSEIQGKAVGDSEVQGKAVGDSEVPVVHGSGVTVTRSGRKVKKVKK